MEKVEASIRAVGLIYPITSYSGVINLLVLNSDIDFKQIKVHLTNAKNEGGYLSPRRSRWRTSWRFSLGTVLHLAWPPS